MQTSFRFAGPPHFPRPAFLSCAAGSSFHSLIAAKTSRGATPPRLRWLYASFLEWRPLFRQSKSSCVRCHCCVGEVGKGTNVKARNKTHVKKRGIFFSGKRSFPFANLMAVFPLPTHGEVLGRKKGPAQQCIELIERQWLRVQTLYFRVDGIRARAPQTHPEQRNGVYW